MTCWRTKGDSNRRYSSENISLRCRPNFRSCAAKWPAEKNPLKGARISFAPQSHGPVLGQRNGTTIRFLISGHFECILRPLDGTKGAEITVLSADPSKDGPFVLRLKCRAVIKFRPARRGRPHGPPVTNVLRIIRILVLVSPQLSQDGGRLL